jgi:CubicO group peptidase (beta-lactamase class C family)
MPKSLTRLFIGLVLFVACLSSHFQTNAVSQVANKAEAVNDASGLSSRLAAIERIVEGKRIEEKIPGVALAIVKDDKIIFLNGFGLRDIEHNLPVTADTLFEIGSTTKAFTAMAAVISVDEGKLFLDDSPKKYLPYFRLRDSDADSRVTIRDLLSHRTGLSASDDDVWIKGEKLSREEVIKAIMLNKPTAKLREKFQYNNVMYTAAGECVAKAQNSTWEEIIVNRIFKPLGMNASAPSLKELRDRSNLSFGYKAGQTPKQVAWRDLTNIAPAGAIISSARDMAQWLRLMIGRGAVGSKRIVSEKSFEELVSRQIKVIEQADYGLGWGIVEWRSHTLVSHAGGTFGFSSQVELMPDQKLGYVLLCNVPNTRLVKEIRTIIWENLLDIH